MTTPQKRIPLVVVCGPTGIGKTRAAIALARQFHGEIISADSMQVYRYMNIGTAKPTAEEVNQARHHMIDVVDPDEHFDAHLYSGMARRLATELAEQGILPIVAGGTGMYIKALLQGLFPLPPVPSAIQDRLKAELEQKGTAFLHRKLARRDPEMGRRLHPNDTARILRALAVWVATGNSIATLQKAHRFGDRPFSVLKIGLAIDRPRLYDRINARSRRMIQAGLLEEVRGLLGKGYSEDLKSMQSIGYRHMTHYIGGKITWDEAVRTLKRDTRRYAKRQLTWFNADKEIYWTEPGQLEMIAKRVEAFVVSHTIGCATTG
jgi:tRNA dimethylallyltransferase